MASILEKSYFARLFLIVMLVLWLALYQVLAPFSAWFVGQLPLERASNFGQAIEFFCFDLPKVFLLLVGIVFSMGLLNSYFPLERARVLLSSQRVHWGYGFAGLLGVVTPFCSCSAVSLFIGFLQAGIPLGMTFTFLVAAPMVNEVALTLLFGLFGWKVAILYLSFGLLIAIFSGAMIGHLNMEIYLQDWVREAASKRPAFVQTTALSLGERILFAIGRVREIFTRVWLYIILGIALGAAIHGYIPEDFMSAIMGKTAWWAVPLAVLVGVPMYTNAAGVIPIVQALLAKGAALGTVLAFMMSVIALSLPEMIILRQVLKVQLLATFIAIVTFGILLVGYLFNLLL